MTAFLYLNDVEEGGETRFTRVPKKPQAKAPLKDSSDWERLRWPCPSAFTIASQRVHHCTQTARRSSKQCLSRPAPAPAPNFSALHPVRGRSSCGRTCSTRTLTWATLSRDTRRAPCGAASSTGPTSGFTSTPSAPARYDLPPSPRPVPRGWSSAASPIRSRTGLFSAYSRGWSGQSCEEEKGQHEAEAIVDTNAYSAGCRQCEAPYPLEATLRWFSGYVAHCARG